MSKDRVLEKYIQLKENVDTAQQRSDRAQGALDQLMKTLEKDFSCSTLKAAKTKLKTLQKQEEKVRDEFETAVEEFEEKWEEQLQEQE